MDNVKKKKVEILLQDLTIVMTIIVVNKRTDQDKPQVLSIC